MMMNINDIAKEVRKMKNIEKYFPLNYNTIR